MKMTAEESLLRRIGIDFQSPAPGCCGMAGSFGFEHDKYDISQAIGELELLPAVRQAPADWLIIADGFSCREQIAQGTNRHALHLAEVLQMALAAPQPLVIPTAAGAQATAQWRNLLPAPTPNPPKSASTSPKSAPPCSAPASAWEPWPPAHSCSGNSPATADVSTAYGPADALVRRSSADRRPCA
jgi:hypothetical protein